MGTGKRSGALLAFALVALAPRGAAGGEEYDLDKAGRVVVRLLREIEPDSEVLPLTTESVCGAVGMADPDTLERLERGVRDGRLVMSRMASRVVGLVLCDTRSTSEALVSAVREELRALEDLEAAVLVNLPLERGQYGERTIDGTTAIWARQQVMAAGTGQSIELIAVVVPWKELVVVVASMDPRERTDVEVLSRLARRVRALVAGVRESGPWRGLKGEEALRACLDALEDPRWQVRWRAARNASRFVDHGFLVQPALERALEDRDHDVRIAALRGLCRFGWHRAASEERLGEIQTDRDWEVRAAFYSSVAKDEIVPKERRVSFLLAAVSESDPRVCAAAFRDLDELRAGQEIPLLSYQYGLTHEDPRVRRAAMDAFPYVWRGDGEIDRVGALLLGAAEDTDANVRVGAVSRLGALGRRVAGASAAVVAALEDEDFHVRLRALYAVCRLDAIPKSALPQLERALENAWHREQAARALGKIEELPAPVIDKLKAALDSDEDEYRFEAARALWRQGERDPRLVEIVAETLRAGVRFVVDDAAECLGEMGAAAVPHLDLLVEAVESEDFLVASNAAGSFGSLGWHARAVLPRLKEIVAQGTSPVRWKLRESIDIIENSRRPGDTGDG